MFIVRVCTFIVLCVSSLAAQVRPSLVLVGGDDVPAIKEKITATLEMVLLEMNRARAGASSIDAVRPAFDTAAFTTFSRYTAQNKPVTARKKYEVQMIERQRGQCYDVRSIMVKVDVGETDASSVQNLIFTFSRS